MTSHSLLGRLRRGSRRLVPLSGEILWGCALVAGVAVLAVLDGTPILAGPPERLGTVLVVALGVGVVGGAIGAAYYRLLVVGPALVLGIALGIAALGSVLSPAPAVLVTADRVVVRPRPVVVGFLSSLPIVALVAGLVGVAEATMRFEDSVRTDWRGTGAIALLVGVLAAVAVSALGLWRLEVTLAQVGGLVAMAAIVAIATLALVRYRLWTPAVLVVVWFSILATNVAVGTGGDPLLGTLTAWFVPGAGVSIALVIEFVTRLAGRRLGLS